MLISNIMYFFIFALIAILSIPVLILFLQVISASFSKQCEEKLDLNFPKSRPVIGILIPAHNEADGIKDTLASIVPQLTNKDQLVVIADNCSDNTAEVARIAGATAIERYDNDLKGKGYALDFGMKYLVANPPEIVLVIDADCIISPNFVSVISNTCVLKQRPIQADYQMWFSKEKTLKQKVIEFAWVVKNKVRPKGYKLLGLPTQLMGTGMAFIWSDLIKCNLASGHLVEDIQLGLDLIVLNKPPFYLESVYVESQFPTSNKGLENQRKRWEHGHIGTILKDTPKLLIKAIAEKNFIMFAQVIDLMVPPLALLFIILIIELGVTACIYFIFNDYLPLMLSLMHFFILGLTILIAWLNFGRSTLSFKDLILVPFILLMKIPLYIAFVVNRQVEWVRSTRD